jgi:tetratricopeptide (TPR) repeat protein
MTSAGGREQEVRIRLLTRVLADRAAGREQPLAFYQAQHPGFEQLVADELGSATGAGAAPAAPPAAAPDRIGPYRIEREIGRGGQAVVFLAQDERLGRPVALKVLAASGPAAEQLLARFRREAEVASRMNHPGICSVYEAGTMAGGAFIAMQFVPGETLALKISAAQARARQSRAARIVDLGAKNPGAASHYVAALIEKVARALHAAHESGVVHRDIKPGNVMITPDGEPVILDFGLAREVSDDLPTLTRTGDIVGTPAYMSPEQVAGGVLDRQTDVYALGVLLFECCTLRRPFAAPTSYALSQRIIADDAPDPRRFNAGLPHDLKAVIEAALHKDRARRYRTALDLADDLRRFCAGRPVAVHATGAAGRAWRWARRRPAHAALAAAAVVLVAALSFLLAKWPDLATAAAQRRAARVADLLERGYSAYDEGDPGSAIAAFEHALREDPHTPAAAVGIAFAHLESRRPQEALAVLARYDTADPRWHALRRLRVPALVDAGRADEARDVAATLPPPQDALDHFVEGLRALYRVQRLDDEGAWPEALLSFHAAVLHSRQAQSLYMFRWAGAVGRSGDPDTARSAANALLDLWPDSVVARFYAGYALQRTDPGRAIELFAGTIERAPKEARYHFNLGNALCAVGRKEEAEQAYRRALALRPTYVIAKLNLANLLLDRDRAEDAVQLLQQVVLAAASAEAFYNLANCQWRLGQTEAALAAYGNALALRPRYAPALSNLGALHLSQGNAEQAVVALQAALAVRPDADVHVNLGAALRELGKQDRAIAATQAAVALQPDSLAAWRNLALMLDEAGGRDEEAMLAWQRVVDLDPGAPAPRERLAEASLRARGLRAALGAAELVDLADRCVDRGLLVAAARFYAEALAQDAAAPALSPPGSPGVLERAALATLRAGLGEGDDAAWLNLRTRTRCLRQALCWLRAAHGRLAGEPALRPTLQRWLVDPRLAPTRADAQSAAPAIDRQDWAAFWSEVTAALAKDH